MDTHAIYEGAIRLLCAQMAAGDSITTREAAAAVEIAFETFRRATSATAATSREVAA